MNASPTAPRIAPLEPPYAEGIQQDFDHIMRGLPPLNIFRTMAQNPRVLSRMVAGGLLDKGSISLRERELVILRTTALCGAEYEWAVHITAYNAKARFTPPQLAATVHGDAASPVWEEPERLLIALCDALQAQQNVDDALWGRLRAVYSEAQLLELLMLAGFYRMVSYLVNTARVEHQPGTPRFPAAD